MKATKYTVSINIEVLSLDAVDSLLIHVMGQLGNEFTRGSLTADDGDHVEWDFTATNVKF